MGDPVLFVEVSVQKTGFVRTIVMMMRWQRATTATSATDNRRQGARSHNGGGDGLLQCNDTAHEFGFESRDYNDFRQLRRPRQS